jgi:hypothetical protein
VWAVCGFVVPLVVVERIESYTANRRLEDFIHRTNQIREGMSEAEVRATAGPPDKVVSDLRSPTDPFAVAASCRDTNGTAAMLYTYEHVGWIGERLGATSSILTEVVCLDDRRTVVNTYSEMMHF